MGLDTTDPLILEVQNALAMLMKWKHAIGFDPQVRLVTRIVCQDSVDSSLEIACVNTTFIFLS